MQKMSVFFFIFLKNKKTLFSRKSSTEAKRNLHTTAAQC